eukprot:TRINITY_DN11322_c0_g1_i1.p1 TRINITY_DN11322_c0_g1~~TRINITY_DN11322_c0_g1_i1.p1  ORF type:complete len:141 (+),score=14.43 TRINITY_DN11322_c0_g1_i1:518-940(+)
MMGINHSYNTKYHQQENRQIKSVVKTIKPILLAKLFKDRMTWSEALKATELVFNKHLVSAITGMSPYQIVFRKPYNSTDCNNLKKHLEVMERVRSDVGNKSIRVKTVQATQCDRNKKERTFTIRDLVLVNDFGKKFDDAQ